ncbi:hypothetical protein B0F90DRAFT_1807167 [Multifurca ochricompacta]|uniref:Uncharacterized protein n=1 Tax=Multifurca ochricompacta TaxID=376703 RepID=A0AAD4MDA7_9AGAM|nr:hypothetical protein B0F90DRAFT_1807167 [Multifurca ochricompacta]
MAEDPSLQVHLSASSITKSQTVRSKQTTASSRSKVVTRPPWAKDEPPSPTDSHHEPLSLPPHSPRGPSEARRSDVVSYHSSAGPSGGEYRWFPFTRRRPMLASEVFSADPSTSRLDTKPATRRMSFAGVPRKEEYAAALGEKSLDQAPSRTRDWGLRITMPTPPAAPHTLAHSRTPGWDSPWAAKPFESFSHRNIYEHLQNGESAEEPPPDSSIASESWWPKVRKRARAYLLNNTYVPLLFRFVNITLTTAALAIAIRIRRVEERNGALVLLAVRRTTLVVIFAPLTLVHVMVAIYLEYFGRPLGLWRTSAKLAHTLLEVLFICAWSAALSLCFDNFFTSPIPCSSSSSISWYSDLPRAPSPFGEVRGKAGEALCDNQVALICLVGIGLLMYCFNLVISLYRIFEKVKYHHTSVWGGSSTRV